MAALGSITSVRPTSSTRSQRVLFGATVSPGQLVYADAADFGKHKLTTGLTQLATQIVGVVITPGVDGSYGFVATGGSIILVGTTMVVGETYFAGVAAAGTIVPKGDLVTTNWIARLGHAITATQLEIDIRWLGLQVPA
jgi:hypothetical protein